MPKLSFTNYLKKRRITETPAGDFVADAKMDQKMPDVTSWDQLDTYLLARGMRDDDRREAARTVWRGYQGAIKS